MSTIESIQRAAPKPRTRSAGALVAIGAVLALAVAMLFILTLNSSQHTATSARSAAHSHVPYMPMIQYRGTGQTPAAARQSTTGAPPTIRLLRAEHSYGAVP